MRIELASKLDELPKAMAGLEAFSESEGLGVGVAQAAELALDELLSNIISYGCSGSGRHIITVDLSVDESALRIVVSDGGIPFNPFEQEEPDLDLSLEERELGGVGIHLVKKFMDECSYRRQGDRNMVTLSKNLAQE